MQRPTFVILNLYFTKSARNNTQNKTQKSRYANNVISSVVDAFSCVKKRSKQGEGEEIEREEEEIER